MKFSPKQAKWKAEGGSYDRDYICKTYYWPLEK